MVKRYAHLAPENLARRSTVIDGLLDGTITSQGTGAILQVAARSKVTH
jgi:hypothetical protein